jgi:uncharacterized protein YfdQ (DUF2303 family)
MSTESNSTPSADPNLPLGSNPNDFARITDARRTEYPAAGKEYLIDGVPLVMVPNNCKLEDFELRLPAPTLTRAKVSVIELDSFCAYVNRFKTTGTTIFARKDESGLTADAILDYPADGEETAWGEHRIGLRTLYSAEWRRWDGKHAEDTGQQAFAEWIEAEARFFRDPSAADMLTLATNFEVRQNVEWKGAVRLDNGDTALNFASETKTGGNGSIEVPKTFTISLPIFQGGESFEITARLKYRIADGKLLLRYELTQVDAILEAAQQRMIDNIREATGIAPLIGAAPSSL